MAKAGAGSDIRAQRDTGIRDPAARHRRDRALTAAVVPEAALSWWQHQARCRQKRYALLRQGAGLKVLRRRMGWSVQTGAAQDARVLRVMRVAQLRSRPAPGNQDRTWKLLAPPFPAASDRLDHLADTLATPRWYSMLRSLAPARSHRYMRRPRPRRRVPRALSGLIPGHPRVQIHCAVRAAAVPSGPAVSTAALPGVALAPTCGSPFALAGPHQSSGDSLRQHEGEVFRVADRVAANPIEACSSTICAGAS